LPARFTPVNAGQLGWLTRALGDVPQHDWWLSQREHEILSTLRGGKRRAEWRLGRWAAKAVVAAWRQVAPDGVEVLAAEDGSPEAFVDGQEVSVALSLSHRGGRALATVGDAPRGLGCDLEALEPRSPAFFREWLRPAERELVGGLAGECRDLAANLLWTAKEAASKARRQGVWLDLRRASVSPQRRRSPGAWEPLQVAWADGAVDLGWWRAEPGWVMAVVSDPAADRPPSDLG
jgi:4'-phosphopantetheinyl transferase